MVYSDPQFYDEVISDMNFDDLHQSRKTHLDGIAKQGKVMTPLTLLLRLVFAISRCLHFEYPLFRLFFKPIGGMFDKAIDKAFDNYIPTEQDVFVCSYFKSGTNWMMQVAHQIANRGEGEFDDILDVIPWADCPAPDTTISLADPRPVQLSKTGLRVIKTHARADYVPYNDKARYICVVRDPKDVVVSGHYFFGNMLLGSLMPSIATWVRHSCSKDAVFGHWADFTNSYWPWRERANVLFLRYEDMQDDPQGTITRLAEWMSVDLSAEEIEKVREKSTFSYMKSIDHKFYPGEVTPFAKSGGSMMRSGKKGGSGEVLSLAQQQAIDASCRERLAELNSDFPYERYYVE